MFRACLIADFSDFFTSGCVAPSSSNFAIMAFESTVTGSTSYFAILFSMKKKTGAPEGIDGRSPGQNLENLKLCAFSVAGTGKAHATECLSTGLLDIPE